MFTSVITLRVKKTVFLKQLDRLGANACIVLLCLCRELSGVGHDYGSAPLD